MSHPTFPDRQIPKRCLRRDIRRLISSLLTPGLLSFISVINQLCHKYSKPHQLTHSPRPLTTKRCTWRSHPADKVHIFKFSDSTVYVRVHLNISDKVLTLLETFSRTRSVLPDSRYRTLAQSKSLAIPPMPATMQRSSYRSTVLSSETSSRDMHKAFEKSPRPKYASNDDRRQELERQPPPPPPSPVHWKFEKDRH